MKVRKYFSGWGNFPIKFGTLKTIKSKRELKSNLNSIRQFIPVGNFRSYGDSALADTMVHFSQNNIQINSKEKTATVSADVLLGNLIDKSLPLGLFPVVVPGTKFVTIGGAIAADIHGKNHHVDGCFSEHVLSFDLMNSDGEIIKCTKKDTPELWAKTCGGMGLTGVILNAALKLRKIPSSQIIQSNHVANSLDQLFELFEKNKDATYSVAWIDCAAKGDNLGKGILMCGEFSENNNSVKSLKNNSLSIPFNFPSCLLNSFTIKIFNSFYFNILRKKEYKPFAVSLDQFFFPLDKIRDWNRLYGESGFLQYQFVLPKENSFNGMSEILQKISQSKKGSPLAVLKLFGPQNGNALSFPIEGYTLALDFKKSPNLFPLLNDLDEIVNQNGGRLYLAKDARMSPNTFKKGYPNLGIYNSTIENLSQFQSNQSKRLFHS